MPVSVRHVAARAGVSVGTVSNVLNRRAHVTPQIVERVNIAIAELGYVPNGAARQLRAGQSTLLALIVLDIANPFFADVARGVEERAGQASRSVLLANSAESVEREATHLEMFETHRVSGVLITPASDDLERLHLLRDRGIGVVLVDHRSEDGAFPSVSVDDIAGGKLAAQHLVDSGRSRLAFVGGPRRLRQVEDRLRGAREAATAADVTIEVIETAALSLEEGRKAGQLIRDRAPHERPDAVFAANDLLALGVQQALLAGAGALDIPGEVALVGYDDIAFAASAVVPVTSVRQPRELMGFTAVELLLRDGDAAPGRAREQVVFQPELVVRESTRAR